MTFTFTAVKFMVICIPFIYTLGAAADQSLMPATDHFPKILDETALKDGQQGRNLIDPCDDFYQFSCGSWIDETVIPADKKAVYRQVTPLDDASDKTLNKILEDYSHKDYSIPSTYATKLADVYLSCINIEKSTASALEIIKKEIAEINIAQSPQQLAKISARLNLLGAGAFFSFSPMQSLDDSTRVIGEIGQGGYALGERDYYFDSDAKSVEIRQRYQDYIAKVFSLLGNAAPQAKIIAAKIMKLETALASKAYSSADQGNPAKTNHPLGRQGLAKLAPNFDWNIYLKELRQESLIEINVDEPDFFTNLSSVLANESKVTLHQYLTWLLVNQYGSQMGGAFEQAHFGFWNAYMNGSKQMQPRWQVCTRAVSSSMGYALAEAYVKTFDGSVIKEKTNLMITQIKSAFSADLHALSTGPEAWLDEATIQEGLQKVEVMGQKVGAPDTFRNYDSLLTVANNFLYNSQSLVLFEQLRNFAKIGKPVIKTDWDMMPWEVNAYYDRANNEFVFPFGILQPPSVDLSASDGANFGSFGGGTIGHELTHGFDNNGAQYDSHGNLRNWWTPAIQQQFNAKAQCYVKQANAYTIQEVQLNVDGAQTLEENLADQGGVKLGYLALENILTTRPESNPWLGKYSERQQYWIAYAQSWCAKVTAESLRQRMTTDSHPPSEFRVNAVIMNRPEFARDFSCQSAARMAPVSRCSIW